ncbi:hypothetical protein ABZV91_16410 [Nocardia sp. NPDC004568]|uniref:hypothetical protein n=1 Tax=Nocardia sp. NPDC004568 TaxID=3154551 RepID=UPI0033AD9E3F
MLVVMACIRPAHGLHPAGRVRQRRDGRQPTAFAGRADLFLRRHRLFGGRGPLLAPREQVQRFGGAALLGGDQAAEVDGGGDGRTRRHHGDRDPDGGDRPVRRCDRQYGGGQQPDTQSDRDPQGQHRSQ